MIVHAAGTSTWPSMTMGVEVATGGELVEFVGGVEEAISNTPTSKLVVDVALVSSTASQATVVVPMGNKEPEGGTHVTANGVLLAFCAVTSNVTVAPEESTASIDLSSAPEKVSVSARAAEAVRRIIKKVTPTNVRDA